LNALVVKRDETVDIAVAVFVTAVAGWLRFRVLGEPSLWLDEILNVEITASLHRLEWWQWLAGFERENGPLYFLLQWIAAASIGDVELAARIPSAAIGTVSIPLFYLAVRVSSGRLPALAAALLLALSPLHVYYSREGRTYALLTLCAIGVLHGLMRSTRAAAITAVAAAVAAAYTAASSAPLLLAAAVAALFVARDREKRAKALLIAAGALAGLLLVAVLYARFPQGEASLGIEPKAGLLSDTVRAFTVAAVSDRGDWRNIISFLIVAALGAAVMTRSKLFAALLFTLLVIAGTLTSLFVLGHWFSPRYLIPALPGFLLAAAFGIVFLATQAASRLTRARDVIVIALVVVATAALAWRGLGAATEESLRRADWRRLATVLAAHAKRGDVVVAANAWTAASLRFYAARAGAEVDIRDVDESVAMAGYVVGRRPRAWLLSGGYLRDRSIERWMCGFDPMAVEPVEEVRLSFAPHATEFIRSRAGEGERQRFAETFYVARGGKIDFGPEDRTFLRGGWHDAEESEGSAFRWLDRGGSVVLPPFPEAKFIHLRAAAYRSGESMSVSLNGVRLTVLELSGHPAPFTIPLPAGALARSENEIRFELPRADVPSSDSRSLSASFDSLEVSSSAQANPTSGRGFVFWPDGGIPYRTSSRKPGPGERALLLRLGLSPHRLPEDVAATAAVALSTDCADDRRFIENLFRIVLRRDPDPSGVRSYVGMLERGVSRATVFERVARSEEFRSRYGRLD
jgi:mannosyltransferase